MPVAPSAEPFSAEGGDTGVLLLHGFTGSPASLRPWGEHLAAEGMTVRVPRLPGHGTSWQEMNATSWHDWYSEAARSLANLRATCTQVFVAGLSMGGCLALRLAEERPSEVAGLLLVNPSVATTDRRLVLTPLLKRMVASVSGIRNDIKRPGGDEYGYERIPLKALDSLRSLWQVTRDDLPKVVAPLVVYRSVEDHVVEPLSAQLITQRVSSTDITERVLDNSYHVATLDYDAPEIFGSSVEFIARHRAVSDRAV